MGGYVNPFFALVVIVIVIWLFSRIVARPRHEPVQDDPEQPYSVFTKEFDVVCAGRDLNRLLAASGTDQQVPAKTEIADPAKRRELAEQGYRSACERFAATKAELSQEPGEATIAFLVDQSGSMVNRMPVLAGQLKAAAEHIEGLGIPTAILGFTTVGWRGGSARESWKRQGSRARPGRLCALLHVIYKSFDTPLADEDWESLLLANVLRENIDGEAIEWAIELLKERDAARRILIVLSDGAPVDDSTLTENGSGFLWRHFVQVVEKTESDGSISIAGLGVGHRVDDVYPGAASVKDVDHVPEALEGLLRRLLA